ncbi:MAG: amino acid adenylation domain-containing protein [Spirosoma sp.]|nr:amino acid adenylation domain-containing protein [Spirosoma sp.]
MKTNQHKVAIIGMSGYFPEATDLNHFGQNLSAGRDSVRAVPDNRLTDSRLPTGENKYQLTGALKEVAQFDHAFFGLSKQDANCMDPMHRIGLELACQAIERAGYGLATMSGSNTGVFLGAKPQADYYTLVNDINNPAVQTGNLPALFAGRIAFSLNLSGPAYMIDTACSSALAAVHEACQKLIYGEIDYALAGAISVMTGFFERQKSDALGIMSPDGKARTFDAGANGTSIGEGGGMVLLKRYDQAVADQDPILAVILGSAANQDGARSNGLTAPSPAAQTEVITKAWKRAAVDPATITYIEAHGTGTKLGDPIEMKGIIDAFKTATDKRNFCAVSSVKTNIGHLDNAAGIAGLLKAVLSLQAKELFPSLHFTQLNPFIDLTDSAVYVNAKLADWCPEADVPRRCGVSSFGLSGTNVHIVLEEGNTPVADTPSDKLPVRLKLSAKSPEALGAYAQRIRESLLANDCDWQNVVYTLNTGRSDYAYRAAITATDKNDLLNQLADLAGLAIKPVDNTPAVVVLLLADDAVSTANVAQWLTSEPLFQTIYESVRAEVTPGMMKPFVEKILQQVAIVRFLEKIGVNATVMITNGIGKLVREIVSGKQTIPQVVAQLDMNGLPVGEDADPEKLQQAIQTLSAKYPNLVFIEPGYGSRLASCLRSVATSATVISLADSATASPLRVTALYNAGLPIAWKTLYESQGYSRTDAPTYPFERVRCWPFEAVTVADSVTDTPKSLPTEPTAQPPVAPVQQPISDDMPVMDRIRAVFRDILKATAVDADDDFFEIGGHSINGAQVANRLADLFDLDISLDTIFEYGTVRQLAGYIEPLLAPTGTPKDTPGGIVVIPTQADYPLSQMQQRIWFLSQFSDAHLAYNMVLAAQIEGVLNPVWVEQALNAVYNRHDSLRTTFYSHPDGPRQVINPPDTTKPGWSCRDASDVTTAERNEWVADEHRQPFDLVNGPLLRAKIMMLPNQQTLLTVSIHHLIADGWSMNVLMDELIQAYEQLVAGQSVNLPALPVQYKDFVAWQQEQTSSDAHRQAHAFWRNQLAGPLPTLDLPTDKPRPALKSYRGAICHRSLPPALTQAALRYGEANGYTLFMLLRATIGLLLYRYTGQRDLMVGSPFSGRTNRTLEDQIGLFINVVGLRTQLDDQQTLANLLAQIKAQTIQVYAHQQFPFDQLIDELALHRDLSRSPLFDVLLAVQNHVMTDRDYTIAGYRATSFATQDISSKYDLSFYIESGANDLAVTIEYCTDLFEANTIDRMLTHLENVLDQLISQPEQLVGELTMISASEQQQVVVDFNRTDQAYDLSLPVHKHFEEQVTRTPNAVALRYKQRSYTYTQLNEHANKLAHYLITEQSVGPDDLVAVMADRSDYTLIALLGIMKAGAAYLPVAADLPAERIRYMLNDSGVQIILASQLVGEVATAVRHVAYIEQVLKTSQSTTNPAVLLPPQSRMYVMYTSGSTGKPKGVEICHRSVLNFLFSIQAYFGLGPGQVFLSVTTFIFDISVIEFFLPLLNGASVRIASKADIQDPVRLAALIEQDQPDLMQATPSLWQMLVDTGWKGHKKMGILSGGEKLSRLLGEQLLIRGRELWNLYGPTETTIYSVIQPVQTVADLATIGKPIANTQVYIVDPTGNLCGLGVFGEICIAGAGLAKGYLNRPDLTNAKFVPNLTDENCLMYRTGDRGRWLANGEIEFLGRIDNQVKIHGHRIELGEIEDVLLGYAGISQAVVTVCDGGHNDKELVAYLVTDRDILVEDVRQHVGRHVASYMIPARFLRVTAMPMTANQKVDRNALSPGLGSLLSQPTSVPQQAATDLEKQITKLVCQVIKVPIIGLTDNLFEYGLNSVRVIALHKLLTDAYPVSLNIHEIFSNPTIRQLTQRMGSRFDSQPVMAIAQTEEIDF